MQPLCQLSKKRKKTVKKSEYSAWLWDSFFINKQDIVFTQKNNGQLIAHCCEKNYSLFKLYSVTLLNN